MVRKEAADGACHRAAGHCVWSRAHNESLRGADGLRDDGVKVDWGVLTIGIDRESVCKTECTGVGETGLKRCGFAFVGGVCDDGAGQRLGCLPGFQCDRGAVNGAIVDDDDREIKGIQCIKNAGKSVAVVESWRDNDEAKCTGGS